MPPFPLPLPSPQAEIAKYRSILELEEKRHSFTPKKRSRSQDDDEDEVRSSATSASASASASASSSTTTTTTTTSRKSSSRRSSKRTRRSKRGRGKTTTETTTEDVEVWSNGETCERGSRCPTNHPTSCRATVVSQVLGLGDRSGSMSINQLDLVSDCVTIKNDTSEPVSMKGWKLLSATGNQVQEPRSKASVIATGHPLTPPAPAVSVIQLP